MICFTFLLILSVTTASNQPEWDKNVVDSSEGEEVSVTCSVLAGTFDIISIVYKNEDNAQAKTRKFSENGRLVGEYKAHSDRYESKLESNDKTLVKITVVFKDIQYIDKGLLACFVLGKEDIYSIVNISVKVDVAEANLGVLDPEGLEGMNLDSHEGEPMSPNINFSTKFFSNLIDLKDSGSKLEFSFNSPNQLVCYANSKSPNFNIKITLNGVDLNENEHHVTRIEEKEDEKFSLELAKKFYWKAVVVRSVDHSFHKRNVSCVAQAPQHDAVTTTSTVSVKFAPVVTCDQKMTLEEDKKIKITCYVSANPIADVNVTRSGDVLDSITNQDEFNNENSHIDFDGYMGDEGRRNYDDDGDDGEDDTNNDGNDSEDGYNNQNDYVEEYNSDDRNEEQSDDRSEFDNSHYNENDNNNGNDVYHQSAINNITHDDKKKVTETKKEPELDVHITTNDTYIRVVTISFTAHQLKHYDSNRPLSILAFNKYGQVEKKVAVSMESLKHSHTGSTSAVNSLFSGVAQAKKLDIFIFFAIIFVSIFNHQ